MRRGIQVAVIVVASVLLGNAALAQQDAPPLSTYDDLVKRGEAAVIGADWNACVKYFTQAHQLRPSEVTYLAIGRCALERGDYVDALRHLQEGMRYSLTERQRVSVENLKARALQHLGRYRTALQPTTATLLIGGQPAQPDAEGYLWFKVGRYPVSVSAPGYESMAGELVVQAGDDGVISYQLAPLPPQGPAPETGGHRGSGRERWQRLPRGARGRDVDRRRAADRLRRHRRDRARQEERPRRQMHPRRRAQPLRPEPRGHARRCEDAGDRHRRAVDRRHARGRHRALAVAARLRQGRGRRERERGRRAERRCSISGRF